MILFYIINFNWLYFFSPPWQGRVPLTGPGNLGAPDVIQRYMRSGKILVVLSMTI